MNALRVRDLTGWYGSTEVVAGLSFDLPAAGALAVLGRNGVGKTSLVRAILGLIRRAGNVEILGQAVDSWATHRIVSRGIAYAPQERAIFGRLSVAENLSFAARGKPPEPARLEEVLDKFPKLRTRFRQQAGTLSGGEQKMLILARALASPASVIVLDEISEGVQPSVVEEFSRVITAERQQGRTLLLVEQHLDFALGLCDRYLVMAGGREVEQAEVTEDSRESIERHLVL